MNLRLKRLELCLGHMMSVPADRVILSTYGIVSLAGIGHDQECGAAGCVLGHLQTIPEYREWEEEGYNIHAHDLYESKHRVLAWLGYPSDPDGPSPKCNNESNLFGPGPSGVEGKKEAVNRLQYLIDKERRS